MFGQRQSGFIFWTVCLFGLLISIGKAACGQGQESGYKGPTFTLTFPDDMSIGKVSILKKDSSIFDFDAVTRTTAAQGKVLAPVGLPLRLEINYEGASHPDKLAHIPFDSFVFLKLEKLPCRDAAIAKIVNQFNNLRRLDMKRLEFTDAGLALLKPLNNLESLRCDFCSIKGPGLASLTRFKKLRYLSVAFGEIDSNQLESLQKLQSVQGLNLRDSKLNDKALMQISKMPSLDNLDIKGNPRITDAGIKYLANLKHLSYLNLTECYKVTPDGIMQLGKLPLRMIEVSGRIEDTPGMTKDELRRLQQAFPKTTIKAISKVTPMYREIMDTLK